jgi:RHS repeat-associated protein
VEVYFDDFKVTQTNSLPVVQQEDFYPFGLTFNSYSRESSVPNQYLFNQGTGEKMFHTERVYDLGLNVDESRYRTYDYTTGRWWQIDPLADEGDLIELTPYNYSDNDPVRLNDPEGDCPQCIWGAVIGAAVDYGTQVAVNLVQGKDLGDALTDVDGKSILISAGVGALTGGLSALKAGSGALKVADAVADVAKTTDKVADVAKTVDKASDVAGAAVKVEKNVASITGHTKHGLNQSIARDGGRGVNAAAKLDAVKNPVKTVAQAGETTKYVGKNAQVVLNKEGKVVSTFGKSRGPQTTIQGKGNEALRRAKALGKEYDPKTIR